MTSINQLEPREAIKTFDVETMSSANWSPVRKVIRTTRTAYQRQGDLGQFEYSRRPKPISISEGLSLTRREELIALIREYIDVFAWNYEDMPGLDPQVAMHHLNIKPDVKPVKQQHQRFRLDIMGAIEDEVHKLIVCDFIREEQHPDWVANIVPVLKKNKKIWVCIDYRDLNIACRKDEFHCPSPMSWLTIYVALRECLLWMASQDTIKSRCTQKTRSISFQIPLGVYCYTVMPFGLKNTGETYQCEMSTIFRDHLRKMVECYVDDITVKSRDKNNHLRDLRTMFDIMRAHQLKMNPTKSFLGVSSGKFLES